MHVYFIEARYPNDPHPFTKIGKARDPAARMAELQVGSVGRLKLLGTLRCDSDAAAFLLERRLHNLYERSHRRGEWYRLRKIDRAALLRVIQSGRMDL